MKDGEKERASPSLKSPHKSIPHSIHEGRIQCSEETPSVNVANSICSLHKQAHNSKKSPVAKLAHGEHMYSAAHNSPTQTKQSLSQLHGDKGMHCEWRITLPFDRSVYSRHMHM